MLKFKMIGDSCMDLQEKDMKDEHFTRIPLTLEVGEETIVDDESFDRDEFLKKVAACPTCPKSACPSPDAFLEAYKEADTDKVFVVTLSEKVSGTYNSAMVAKSIYEETQDDSKKIHVISSHSAACGEAAIALKIREFVEANLSFHEIVRKIEAFRDNMKTYFVLESLDTLRKNGRMSDIQAFIASALNIKPLMGAIDGVIVKLSQARGLQRVYQKLVDRLLSEVPNTEDKTLCISECNSRDRAIGIRDLLLSKAKFKDVYIVPTQGVATMYANEGGIIVSC